MNRPKNARRRGTEMAASHQRSWLWGRNAVLETLLAGRWPVLDLYASSELSPADVSSLRELAVGHGLTLQTCESSRIEQLCHAADHQGFLARMGQFPCGTDSELQQLLSRPAAEHSRPPLFVLCDRIRDAHNFGAILRSCDAMAVDGVIIGERDQCGVTPHVARSSAGAVNSLHVFRVPDLLQAAGWLRTAGVELVAASEKSAVSLWQCRIPGAAAIVIGTEATGIAAGLLESCTVAVRIPMLGRGSSLNAAVAAGILLAEIRRQQCPEG